MGRPSTFESIVEDGDVRAVCGSLKLIDRHRNDPRPQVQISATYVVFDPAKTLAERRYNEWVGIRPAQMNFSGPIDTPDSTEDTLIGELYRSPKLLSASIGGWVCCGAHGMSWAEYLNVDPETGRDIHLDELVEIAPVSDFCWKMFAELTGPMDDQGKFFSERYPRVDFVKHVQGAGWSVRQSGLAVDFGYLLGYVGAGFVCEIRNEDLRRFTRTGVSVPL